MCNGKKYIYANMNISFLLIQEREFNTEYAFQGKIK